MIKYIGEISKQDAEVLRTLAEQSKSILEFGVGASTQIIAKYRTGDRFDSIDTSTEWIDRTKSNLDLLEIDQSRVNIVHIDAFRPDGFYDFIFIDGKEDLRLKLALDLWPNLAVGGIMAFHDTRRPADIRNVLELVAHHQNEVHVIQLNVSGSNISFVRRKELEQWYDWNVVEKREPWEIGYGKPDLKYYPK
jgi:predicted O-methyltransferase YrrM